MKHDEKTSDTLKLIRNIEESCANQTATCAAYAAPEKLASKTNKYVYLSAQFSTALIVVLSQIKVNAPDLYKDLISYQMKRFEDSKKEF